VQARGQSRPKPREEMTLLPIILATRSPGVVTQRNVGPPLPTFGLR
jgi:hypothetical protein